MSDDKPPPVAPLSADSLRLGPYRIVRELGTGGMGTVYLGVVVGQGEGAFGPLPSPGSEVALKCFHPHLVGTDDFAGRFRREARAGAKLRHENVVHTFDAGSAEFHGRVTSYLAMEYVEGQTLRDLIRELARVPEALASNVALQVAAGLAAIHESGITHRDLKPENVIITGDHRVKLMDLGVAKVRDASIRLSLTGQFLGSVHYASPEQFRDPDSVDARTDLYALGILLHEMLTGQNPFYHNDLQVVLRKTLTEAPRRVSALVPELSPVLDQLVDNLVQKDPALRIPTATLVLEVLEHGDQSEWWRTRGKGDWEQTGRRKARRLPVERDTPLFGRDEELKRLRTIFDAAAGGDRQFVVVEGEAGIGKTRLLDEFAAGLTDDRVPHRFTYASIAPPGSGRPYQAFSEALLREIDDADVTSGIAALLPEGAPVEEFVALLEGRPVTNDVLTRDLVRSLFASCFQSLAEDRPLFLVIEDAHVCGDNEASLLSYLARDERGVPLMLAISLRPLDDVHPLAPLAHGQRDSRVHHVALPRLGAKEVGLLLRAALQSERAVQELGFRLMEKTEGNPYFIFEVLRSLKHEQVLKRRGDGIWTIGGTRVEINVPNSVRELLHATLAKLPEEDREILDVACVIGMEFEPDVLAELLGRPRLALLKRLSHLERKHRLIQSVGRRCRFDHLQLRETLYAELMDGLREEYHALVGAALERRVPAGAAPLGGARVLDITRHYLLGARLEEASRHIRPALAHILSTYASETGERLTRRFLELDEAADRPSSPALRTEVLLALAECLGHEGLRTEERDVLELAAEEVESADAADLLRRTLERRLSLHFGLGEFPRAEVVCREAFRAAARAKDRPAAIAALGNLGGALRSQGRFDEAINALRRALSWVVPEGSDRRRCLLTTSLGLVQVARGHVPSAQRLYLQARAIAEGFGLGKIERVRLPRPRDDDHLRTQFAGLARALGRYAESRVDAERTLLLASDLPMATREAAALLALGLLAGHLDQLGDARAALQAARERAASVGDRRFESAIVQALGENAVQALDSERARLRYSEALEMRRSIGYRPGVCESLLALGQVAAMAGDVEAARPYLDEALELAPALEMPGIAALARATAALLYAREGRRDRAREQLEEAHRALGLEGPLSVSSRAEGLYFAAMAARALGDETAHRAYMWQAYELVQEIAERLPAAQRTQFLKGTSPNREIVGEIAAMT